MRDLILIGVTGHTESVLDSALSMKSFDNVHLIEPAATEPRDFHGFKVHAGVSRIKELMEQGARDTFIACGCIGGYGRRLEYYELAITLGLRLINVIDPSACVSTLAEMGQGVFVGKQGVVNAFAKVGPMAIINTGATVDHNCDIAAFTNIAPGAILCGSVSTGLVAYIGAGSVIRECMHIGAGAFVGMGSLVLKDVPEGKMVYGRPAQVVGDYRLNGPTRVEDIPSLNQTRENTK